MNASELRRWLKKQGCTFETHRGGSGHLTVRRGNRTSQLPMHGGRKQLGKGLAGMSHHQTVAARDTTARTSLRLLAVLDVLSSTPARQAARASS